MTRNMSFVTKFIRSGYNVRKAMDKFRHQFENKTCAYCGINKTIEIHHIVPVSVDATLADREDNFIALCRKCHRQIGHAGNYKNFVPNIKEICELKQVVITREYKEL